MFPLRRLVTLLLLLVILGTFKCFCPTLALSASSSKIGKTTDYEQRSCQFVKGLHSNLIRFITQEGFHRDLEDTLEVTVTTSSIPIQSFTTRECIFGLLHEFSKDVFVDPYEIQRNPALSNQIRVLNNWTDLESPAWLSKSNSTVFVQLNPIITGNLISTESIPLPIHYRYQLPRSHSRSKTKAVGTAGTTGTGMMNPSGYVTVTLPLPDIILRCEHWDTAVLEEQCKTISTICHQKANLHETCSWALLPYKSNLKSGSVHIPVGDTDSTFIITIVTIGVVICGMVLLIVTLVRAKKQLLTENTSQSSTGVKANHPHPHLD